MTFAGNIPYNDDRPELAAVRVPGEQPLAVLQRPDVGQGHGTRSRPASSTGTTSSRTAAGAQADGRPLQLQPARDRRLRRQRQQPRARPAIPSRRSCSGRCTTPTQTIPVHPDVQRDLHRAVDQRRVQGRTKAHADARDCASTTSPRARRANDQYSTFDPNTPNPGAGGRPGRADLRGRRAGSLRARGRSRTRSRTPGVRGSGFAYRLGDKHDDPRRLRDLLRRTWPSTSSSASRRSGSRRTRWRRTRPTASSPRSTWTTDSRSDRSGGRRSSTRPFANGGNVAGRAAGRVDAAALPELVGDVPAPAHRQHDAGRLLHREPREPAESPLRSAAASTPT